MSARKNGFGIGKGECWANKGVLGLENRNVELKKPIWDRKSVMSARKNGFGIGKGECWANKGVL
jgi:hypothetical protein